MSRKLLIYCLILIGVLATIASFSRYTIIIENEQSELPLLKRMHTPVGVRTVTAYTLGRVEENDSDPCIGAYNDNLCELAEKGVQICATREFPKGTLLKVGDIECVVLDKTSRKYAGRVDLAKLDYNEAIKFGINELQVSVMDQATTQNDEQ